MDFLLKKRRVFLFSAILLLIVFSVSAVRLRSQSSGRTNDLYRKIQTLNEIINLVNENYVDPVEWDGVMEGAFDGLLERLDPHSNYIPKERFETIQEQFVGKFEGIGIEFDIIDDWITVIAPVPGTPS